MNVVRWQPLRVVILCAFALSGCDQKKETSQQGTRVFDRAVQAAQEQIRSGTRKPSVAFRGVVPWTQALPNRVAVCGQAAVSGDGSGTFVPFVSVVSFAATENASPARIDYEAIGSAPEGLGNFYQALVEYCWEKGGPKSAPVQTVAPQPPVPANTSPTSTPAPAVRAATQPGPVPPAAQTRTSPPSSSPPTAAGTVGNPSPGTPQVAGSPAPASPAPPPPAETASGGSPDAERAPASGTVTMRQNGNLRASPRGSVVRVVQQGTTLKVFSQAAGGWYEVGDAAPWGWIHVSMLNDR